MTKEIINLKEQERKVYGKVWSKEMEGEIIWCTILAQSLLSAKPSH